MSLFLDQPFLALAAAAIVVFMVTLGYVSLSDHGPTAQ